jgi:spore germination protein
LSYAKTNGLKSFMCMSNYGPNDFNSRRIHAVLSNKKAKSRLINRIISIATASGFDGVNIDFEAIPARDRSKLTAFMTALSNALHAQGLKLVMSVPAIESDDPHDDWAGAFDFAALGQVVDILQVMTYDENGPWGAPGPVAGLPWVETCINYAKTVVPASKISMGVPGYGYEWNLDNGKAWSLNQAEVLTRIQGKTVVWDDTQKSPKVEFMENGQRHVIWFENSQSLTLKGDFARSSGIGGVSVWALDGLSTAYWNALLG